MAHVPFDDARELFNLTNPKNWPEFFRVVHQHRGKAEGIQDRLIVLIMEMRSNLEPTPFPGTPEQLQNVLNQQLAEMGQKGVP